MSRRLHRPIHRARDAYAKGEQVADGANELFLTAMGQIEAALFEVAEEVSTNAVSLIPAAAAVLSEAALELGRRAEPAAATSRSVVIASLPGAFYRTAVTVSWLGSVSARRARRLARLLLGGPSPASERIAKSYRTLGRVAAASVRDGLDAFLAAESVRAQLDEVKQQERRRTGKKQRGGGKRNG